MMKYLWAGSEPTTQGTRDIGGWKIKQVKLNLKKNENDPKLNFKLPYELWGTASVSWLYLTLLKLL